MQVSVHGVHVDVGLPYQERIEEALKSLQDKYKIEMIDVQVQLSKNSHEFTTEISAHIGRGVHMRSSEAASEAYSSADAAINKLDTRLRRHKKKLTDHNRKRDNHHPKEFAPYYVLSTDEEAEPIRETKELAAPVVAELETEVPTLSVSDAVLYLDLSDQPSLFFKNMASGEYNMIYHRKDGNIGWVEPKA